MTQVSDKQEFKEKFDFLHEVKGISITKISKASDIAYSKLRDIRHGKSSGNSELLEKLKAAYSEYFKEGNQPDNSERLESLEEEMEQMKKENMEMKDMLLRLQNELLTKKK